MDRTEIIETGGDLSPASLLSAYSRGLFPMDCPDENGVDVLCWWSPHRRGIIDVGAFAPNRSMRRARAAFEIRVDTVFETVIDGCADPARPWGWITPEIRSAYVELHRLGHAHSIEAWSGGELGGGLYGVAIGGLFGAESKFHRITGGSKAAVAGLVELLAAAPGGEHRIVDTQWSTEHLASIGVMEIPRGEYLVRLQRALALAPVDWAGRAAVPR